MIGLFLKVRIFHFMSILPQTSVFFAHTPATGLQPTYPCGKLWATCGLFRNAEEKQEKHFSRSLRNSYNRTDCECNTLHSNIQPTRQINTYYIKV